MQSKFLPALGLLAAFAWTSPLLAAPADTPAAEDSVPAQTQGFLNSLHPATGDVVVPGAQATLKLDKGYSFLQAKEAQDVLTRLWNNPPDQDVLGMILPSENMNVLLDDKAWAVVVTFVDEGYVSDEDAAKLDYNQMLKDMQEASKDENTERLKQGYPAIELVGWAEQPHYDAASHKLYWARNLKFKKADGSSDGASLNYAIRVLGRRGYLSLNAVAPIDQLAQVRADMPKVLEMTEFNDGERYTDYNSKTDKVAAYGIGALVAGGIAAKAGLFAKLGVILLGFKKLIMVGVVAIGGFFARLFGRKKAQ
ncbi:DUF2167 domain-containing protein [Dyella sp. LX-66]|uniref:DUF2167 domain-containing protein n=1 Tax=unclassified Dyella TaxID=2634549 RepID=UPI001BE0C17C|nr:MULTISPECIES: DUF2167 domain-containing protein [unclassified Dyella]MBT2116483.1 DUF2167 domain-containing protein [Dyella sp. LX-1]MBT2140574.1 DUF2167 domain-containing protein [Dyella sp. LX-66]